MRPDSAQRSKLLSPIAPGYYYYDYYSEHPAIGYVVNMRIFVRPLTPRRMARLSVHLVRKRTIPSAA